MPALVHLSLESHLFEGWNGRDGSVRIASGPPAGKILLTCGATSASGRLPQGFKGETNSGG